MRSLFLSLFLLSLACLPGESRAGEKRLAEKPDTLSLAAVTAEALQNNPSIRAALARWSAMKTRVVQASAWDDTKLSVDVKAARFVEVAPNAFMNQTVGVEQLIPISGKNLVRARIAGAEALAAFEDVRRKQLDVVTQVRASYLRLVNASAQLDLNQTNISALQQVASVVRSGYEAGTSSAADALAAETEASRLEETQRDLERRIADEKSRLNVLMNRDAFLPLGVPRGQTMRPVKVPIEELRGLMFAQRPEIRSVEALVEAEQQRVQLTRREWIPDPAITVQGQRYNDTDKAISEIDTGISIGLPWGNAKKYSAATKEAKDNLAARQAEVDDVQKQSLGLLREQLQKIETAHHHVVLFQGDLLAQAQKTAAVTQSSYEAGKATFADWINAQRLLREIQATALDREAEYEISLAELEGVIGAELPSASLKKPNQSQ